MLIILITNGGVIIIIRIICLHQFILSEKDDEMSIFDVECLKLYGERDFGKRTLLKITLTRQSLAERTIATASRRPLLHLCTQFNHNLFFAKRKLICLEQELYISVGFTQIIIHFT